MNILDANVWIAFLYKDDSQHKKAEKIVQICERPILLPEYVIIEVSTVLIQKAGRKISAVFLEMLMQNKDIHVLFSDDQFFMDVVYFLKSRPEEKLSFVDFTLLYLSRSYDIITFDRNLQKAIEKL